MKKNVITSICLALAAVMLLALAACGKESVTSDVSDKDESADWQNIAMNFIGEYQWERAHALVEAEGDDGVKITIEWGGSAWSLAKWVITGKLDPETLTVNYTDSVKSEITYNGNGEIEKEDVIYTDGTGSVVFNDNGTFTWKDDRSEYGDILFEWLSTKN